MSNNSRRPKFTRQGQGQNGRALNPRRNLISNSLKDEKSNNEKRNNQKFRTKAAKIVPVDNLLLSGCKNHSGGETKKGQDFLIFVFVEVYVVLVK